MNDKHNSEWRLAVKSARLAPMTGMTVVRSDAILAVDEVLQACANINPFGSVENALARDAARSATTATTASAASPSPTADQILAGIEAMVLSMGKEPIAEWMRSKGWPPEKYTLVLPETLRPDVPPTFWPSYVRFNKLVTKPVAVIADHPLWSSLR